MLLITHNDLDGVMCAILHKFAFGGSAAVEYVNYDEIDNLLTRLTKSYPEEAQVKPNILFVTDISPTEANREAIGKLLDEANTARRVRIRLFDHHKSSLPLKRYDWVSHRMDVCGAQIYYDWLVENGYLGRNDGLGNLVHMTDLWDRRVAGDPLFPKAQELNSLRYFFGIDPFVSRCLATLPNDVLHEHKDVIVALRQKERDTITAIIQKGVAGVTDYQGKQVALFVSTSGASVSDICDEVLKAYPEADYAAAILPGSNTVSMRSRADGLDIEPVAKTFGGGGHPHAAGFVIQLRELLMYLIGEMFQCGTKDCKTPLPESNASEK